MAHHDLIHPRLFTVVETFSKEGVAIEAPRVVIESPDFIKKIIDKGMFLSLFVETDVNLFSFFPSFNQARDYCESRLATHH